MIVKLKPVLTNESAMTWKKLRLMADCFYNTGGGESPVKRNPVGAAYIDENVEMKPNDKRELNLEFSLAHLKLPAGRSFRCDVLVSEAEEVMY